MSNKLAKGKSKKQNKNKTDFWQIADMICTYSLAFFSCLWIFLILVVLPLYFQEGYVHIGSDKSYLFRTTGAGLGKVVLPLLALWAICRVICVVRRKRQECQKLFQKEDLRNLSMVDVCAALYLGAAALSYLCTDYRETALWGTKGWYMGLVPQVILVVSYFVLSRFEFGQLGGLPLFLCFPISAVTFVLGYLNRFDIWPLNMPSSGLPDYISTIGNINWYCSYVVITLFLGVALFLQETGEKRWHVWLWMGYLWLGFGALLTQGSDSGVFAALCMLLVLFDRAVRGEDVRRMLRFWQTALLFSGAGAFTWVLRVLFPGKMNYMSELGHVFYSPLSLVLVVVCGCGILYTQKVWKRPGKEGRKPVDLFRGAQLLLRWAVPVGLLVVVALITVNTLRPGSIGPLSDSSVFTFNNEWGSRRGATWMLGIECFGRQDLLHKLVGVGPDCMSDYLYSDSGTAVGLAETAMTAFDGRRLTNAHCELLTILVNLGVVGALCYAGMLVGFFRNCLKGDKPGKVAVACGIGVLALMFNNLWSFQQSMGVSTMFVVLALGEYFQRNRI
ncbi:MAG: O-antigen ligase family protein [Lachnospiraceae bacterium]|nr:O-antigen ligase family protein [Lachnospiraceae bacterium]